MKMFISSLSLLILFSMVYLFSCKYLLSFIMELKVFKSMSFYLMLDTYSFIFLLMLLTMVFSVLSFSSFYMKSDIFSSRFMKILILFVMSMMFLMIFPDLLFVLLGWDGLGVTSFLLILFYSSGGSWQSGFKTFLINRLGDGLMIMSMVTLLSSKGFFFFSLDKTLVLMKLMLMFFGFSTKSAQYPFSSWLPAAMAAPTPVSSLVHSSTLVTAGLYLMFRKMSLLTCEFKFMLFIVGTWTMILASLSAMVEKDMKKMMAYSTLSQLGLISMMISLDLMSMGFFHLLTHACFKALLFMLSGMLLYNFFHKQDVRLLSNLNWLKKITKISFIKVKFSLCGLFFLSGFFSKDKLIEGLFSKSSFLVKSFMLLSACLTIIYSFRLLGLVMNHNNHFKFLPTKFSFSFKSYIFLFMLSMISGWLMKNMFSELMVVPSKFNNYLLIMMMMMYMLLNFTKVPLLNTKIFYKMLKVYFLKSSLFMKNFSQLGYYLENVMKSWKKKILLTNTFQALNQNSLNLKFKFSLYKSLNMGYWFKILMLLSLVMILV